MTVAMDRPLARSRLTDRRLRLALVVAAAAVLATAALLSAEGSKQTVRVPRETLTVQTVRTDIFHDFAVLRARAMPKDIVYLDALEGGQVQKVLAQAGDEVVAGQPIVQFRNTQLELDVLDREGRLVESITQLQAYEKQLNDARLLNLRAAEEIDYNIQRLMRLAERRDVLMERGFLPKAQHDQVHDELVYNQRLKPLQAEANRRQEAMRQEQLPRIRAELADLRRSLEITRSKLNDLIVRAPVSGRLTDTDLYIGQIRGRGERLGQIVPGSGFKLQAGVDEYYLERVRVGQTAEVEANGRTWRLHVSRVDPQVKDGAFQVDLRFDNGEPPGLLPGQALEGKLALGGDRRAVLLPAGGFLESTGGDWMMVVSDDGRRADRRRIRLGRRNADQVEVLAGLRPGERVITSDYSAFAKAERVALTN